LKRGARREQMQRCRIRCLTRQLDGLRQRQGRWRSGQSRARQRRDGTNGAEIVRVLTRIRGGRRQLLLSRLNRRRGLRCDGVEMAKGNGKLDRERKQRDPCAKSDIRPHPLHRNDMPRAGTSSPFAPTLQYNIASTALVVNRPR
jgi:hypothetical protein